MLSCSFLKHFVSLKFTFISLYIRSSCGIKFPAIVNSISRNVGTTQPKVAAEEKNRIAFDGADWEHSCV